MNLPSLGLLADHGDRTDTIPLLVALRAWCAPESPGPGVTPRAILALSPDAVDLDAALSGSLPVAVIVDEPSALSDSLVSRATAIVVRDESTAQRVGESAILWRPEALPADLHPSLSPFLRQRWRLRLGLPAEFIVEIGTASPTQTSDDELARSALAVCSAAVVRGPRLVTALALGTAVVTDATSAEQIGATPTVHLAVADSNQARTIADHIGADHARAAALGWGGRLLVEERFDLATVALELVDALGIGPAAFPAAPLARFDAELAALGTAPSSAVSNRALRRVRAIAGAADWSELTGRRR